MNSLTDLTPTQPKKILVVDDEQAVATVLEVKLRKSGYEAKAVFGGEAALAELRVTQYDLVLLDLMMPDVDGWTVLDTIRREKLAVPVIVTSNLGQSEDAAKALTKGAHSYLVKSNETLSDIVDAVRDVIGN